MPAFPASRWLLCAALAGIPACAQVDSPRTLSTPGMPRGAAVAFPQERGTASLQRDDSSPVGAAASAEVLSVPSAPAPNASTLAEMNVARSDEVVLAAQEQSAEGRTAPDQADTSGGVVNEPSLDAQSGLEPESAAPMIPPAPDSDGFQNGSGSQEGGLELADLEQMALENNPTLRQAAALVQQAQGNWLQVGLYPNPTAGYTAGEIGNDGDAGQQGAFLAQDIVTADKLQLNRAVTSWDIERARWQAEAQRLRVLNSVRSQFYTVLGAQRTVAIAEQLLEIAEQGVEIAQQLFEAQQSPRSDVLQAEVDLATVQLLSRTARRQQQAARRQLAALVGIPELPPVPLAGDLTGEASALDYETDWQRLASTSPVLQIARTQVDRARVQLRREEVQPIPDVQLQGSVQQDFASDYTIFGAQIGVMLPTHNRNQGNIAAALAELRRAMENVARIELVLRQQLADAHRRYDVARTQVELYRESILPKAEETLNLTTQGYRAGEVDFLRVLTARRTYIQNEVNYIAALTELRTASVEIEGLLLTGGLTDPAETAVNPGGGGGGTRPLTITPKTE